MAFKGLSKFLSKCTANNKSIHAMSHVLHNQIEFPQPQGLITKVVNTITKSFTQSHYTAVATTSDRRNTSAFYAFPMSCKQLNAGWHRGYVPNCVLCLLILKWECPMLITRMMTQQKSTALLTRVYLIVFSVCVLYYFMYLLLVILTVLFALCHRT